jgi:hypothetical protein
MSEIGTEEHPSKAEYRLKIRLGGHLSQFVNLRTPATPGGEKWPSPSKLHAPKVALIPVKAFL